MKTTERPQYITQLNAFHCFTESNYLPASAQLLWYKLISLCNACGWPEWLQIDTMRMMVMLDVKSQAAAYRARDALIEAGLLRCEKGRKGCPNRYRLLYFPYAVCAETACESETVSVCDSQNEQKTVPIIRQDKETDEKRQAERGVPAELSEVWRTYADMRKRMRKPLTDAAAQLVLATLEKLAPDRTDVQRKILEQSILNGWAGVYPLKQENAPEPPASYDVAEIERRLFYGKIEYKKRE